MSAIVSPRHMAFDRRFHALACTAAFASVFVGFARTYYLEFLFGTPALPWLVHLHGALMTSWFVLFFTQTYLIASHRTSWHPRETPGASDQRCKVDAISEVS
jgi:hypothetical protein